MTPAVTRGTATARAASPGLHVRAWRLARRLQPAHLCLSVLLSSIVVMSLVNFTEAPGWAAGALFPIVMVGSVVLLLNGPAFPTLSRNTHITAVALAAVLFLPRLPYLLEPLLGYSVGPAVPDDWFHIQEIAALAYTPRFPAISTFDPQLLLNYYYALWMLPDALFKLSRGALTVKASLGISAAVYSTMISYFVAYAARILFERRGPRMTAVVLVLLFGGFGSFSVLVHADTFGTFPSTAENWPGSFGFNIQWSSFATLALWVPQHLIAGLAAVAALYILAGDPSRSSFPVRATIAGLLFAFSAFSSAFAALGAAPLIAWFALTRRKALLTTTAAAVAALVAVPLAWLYLARSMDRVGFVAFGALLPDLGARREVAFVVFLVVLTLQFAPLFVGALAGTRGDRTTRGLFLLSVAFLGSAFFVSYVGFNNYPARGLIVPVLTLTWLAAAPIHRAVADRRRAVPIVVLAAYCIGGPYSYWSVVAGASGQMVESDTALNRTILRQNELRRGYSPDVANFAATDERWYLIEDHVGERKPVLTEADVETVIRDSPLRVSVERILGLHH